MTNSAVSLSVSLNGIVPRFVARHADLGAFAVELEAIGVDQIVVGEHLLHKPRTSHPGGVAVDLAMPFVDPFVTLASVAAATTTLRLTTGAVIAPTRSAVVLAKLAASVDAMSAGRFSLGITSGWYEPEFVAVGVPFEERFARLDEAIDVCRALWGPQPASFHGRWTVFDDETCLPTPVAGERMPIWFGGLVSDHTARRVARCDGWIVSEATTAEELPDALTRIAAACEQRGRPADGVGIRATVSRRLLDGVASGPTAGPAIDAVSAQVARLAASGATDVVLPIVDLAADRSSALELCRGVVERLV